MYILPEADANNDITDIVFEILSSFMYFQSFETKENGTPPKKVANPFIN